MKLELITNVEFDWNGRPDYPEFTNAFICSCDYDGKEADDDQLDYINDYFIDEFYDEIYESLL